MPNNIFTRKPQPTEEYAPLFSASAYNKPRGITASAAPLDLKSRKEVEAVNKRRASDTWQEEAWEYYDLIGEIKASANLISNVLSRINIYAAYVEDSASVPSKIDMVENLPEGVAQQAIDILMMLESGNGGTSGLLRDAALNLFVVGECYLVKEPGRYLSDPDYSYQIRSVDEIVTKGRETIAVKPRRDAKPVDYIPLQTPGNKGYAARIWRSHPRYGDEADSSLRGLLDICDELLLLGRTSRATAKSRLNAGLLFIPDTITASKQADSEDMDMDDETNSIENELMDAIVSPVEDEASASSVVPLLMRGPEDQGEKIKFIKFERSFDPQIIQRSERLLDRILAGLDIPLDVAKGLSGVKYSNAILIEEQLYKAHVEPLILMIVDCLTVGFLRPALRAAGVDAETVARTVVWYDPSAITAKPSKAEAATTGYGIGAVSLEAWRRFNGFAETDAPSQLERAQRFANERGALSEPLTEALVRTMVPQEILDETRQAQLAESDPASANALQQALGGGPAAPAGQSAPPAGLEGGDATGLVNPISDAPQDLIDGTGTPAPGAAPAAGGSGLVNPVSAAPKDLID